MSGILGGGAREVKPPAPTPPAAIPEVGDEAGDIARKRLPRGRQETFLTGALTHSEEFLRGKKKRLG